MLRTLFWTLISGILVVIIISLGLVIARGEAGPQPELPTPLPAESWQPAPGDENLQRAEVEIERSEIISLESFPPQFQLQLTGWKGNPCNLLRVVAGEPDEQNRIYVDVYTLFDPAALCIQRLDSFTVQAPLGSPPAGEYSVWVNGALVGSFVMP